MRVKRLRLWAAFSICTALVPGRAHAADKADRADKEKCRASYEEAQELRRRSALVEARAELSTCIATCPSALRSDCDAWLRETDKLIPKVTFRFVDDLGDSVAASLQIDGVPTSEPEKTLNPGKHTFRAEAPGHDPIEMRELIGTGETRSLVFTLKRSVARVTEAPASPAPVTTSPTTRAPVAAYIVGGIGIAAIATSGILAAKGHVDKSDLTSTCAPNCNSSDVDSIRTTWWVAAGVGAGGAVLTGIATYLFLNHRSHEQSVAFTVAPAANGAHAAISGRF